MTVAKECRLLQRLPCQNHRVSPGTVAGIPVAARGDQPLHPLVDADAPVEASVAVRDGAPSGNAAAAAALAGGAAEDVSSLQKVKEKTIVHLDHAEAADVEVFHCGRRGQCDEDHS